jgi:pimeloyl-ACP methyl ester carboxylesterase
MAARMIAQRPRASVARVIERLPGEVALHLEIEGDGDPALVLMHGFGGSARNWRPQQRTLKSAHRVALFDVRGHARSDAPDDASAYRPACFANDVARVLDRIGAERAVVGGLSMGAGIAARFAIASPERVRGLVLASIPPGAGEGTRQRDWALAFADALERDGLAAAGARFAWGPESGLDANAAKLVQLGFAEHAPHALAHTLRELLAVQPGADALAAELAPLDAPILLLAGERDPVSLGPTRRLAAALPRAELVVVPGAGHAVNLEARDAVGAALMAFAGRC